MVESPVSEKIEPCHYALAYDGKKCTEVHVWGGARTGTIPTGCNFPRSSSHGTLRERCLFGMECLTICWRFIPLRERFVP